MEIAKWYKHVWPAAYSLGVGLLLVRILLGLANFIAPVDVFPLDEQFLDNSEWAVNYDRQAELFNIVLILGGGLYLIAGLFLRHLKALSLPLAVAGVIALYQLTTAYVVPIPGDEVSQQELAVLLLATATLVAIGWVTFDKTK